MRTSTSQNHFLDTNVLIRHANKDSGQCEGDIQRILDDGAHKRRQLWVSSILFAELRESSFVPNGRFRSVDELVAYIHSISTVISPDPQTCRRAARLRDQKWLRPADVRMANELPRCMSLGDSLHICSALWIKENLRVADLEFLTFDDGRGKTSELDENTKSLSLLRLEQYVDGIASHPDVAATIQLPRLLPILKQNNLSI